MTMKIDSAKVVEIASGIEAENNKLRDLLIESNATISSLKSDWTGDAAEETFSSFDTFSKKYSEIYYETLNNYVRFLREAVSDGYNLVEGSNFDHGDLFK